MNFTITPDAYRQELINALERIIGGAYIAGEDVKVFEEGYHGSGWTELIGKVGDEKTATIVAAIRLRDRLQYELDLSAILTVRYEGVPVDKDGKRLYGVTIWKHYGRIAPGDPEYLVNGKSVHKNVFDRIKQLQQEHRKVIR